MTKLVFLGTKGEIEEENPLHRFNSSLLVIFQDFKLLIDHGLTSPDLAQISPSAILITHSHPDHFAWLKKDVPYEGKIYVSLPTLNQAKFTKNFEVFKEYQKFTIGPFSVLPYPVIHSLLAPTVGFRIEIERKEFVYNPDIIVMEKKDILEKVSLYIGDGSSFKTNLVRRKKDQLFGHTRMKTQVNWCKQYQIPQVIFTHLGKEVINLPAQDLENLLSDSQVSVKIAYDGMEYLI